MSKAVLSHSLWPDVSDTRPRCVRRRNEYAADHPARARLQAVLDAIEAKVASLYRVTVSPDPIRDLAVAATRGIAAR